MTLAAPPMDLKSVWSVFGVPIDAVTLEEAANRIREAVETRTRLSFVTPNLNWLMRALRDPIAMRQVREADLSLADGAPIVWLARQLGAPLPERVAGSDLFDALRLARPGQKPIRVFFFGGRSGAAEAANAELNSAPGGLLGCGALNPGFGSIEDMGAPVLLETINRARPDFLVVSLGAAKGQDWIARYQSRLDVPVIAHLGAVVDFVGGTVRRSPAWMSRAGLEWLWRIYADPALWRRYFSDGLGLLGLVPRRLWPTQREIKALSLKGPAEITHKALPSGIDILVSGDLVSGSLDGLSAACHKALTGEGSVLMDLSSLGRIDGAALGTLARLQGRLEAEGRGLSFKNIRPEHRSIFERMSLMPVPDPSNSIQTSQDMTREGVPSR